MRNDLKRCLYLYDKKRNEFIDNLCVIKNFYLNKVFQLFDDYKMEIDVQTDVMFNDFMISSIFNGEQANEEEIFHICEDYYLEEGSQVQKSV